MPVCVPTNLVPITMKLRGGDLANAMNIKLLRSRTRPLPRQVVNRACFSIANRAFKAMPVVSPAQMDAELNVKSVPVQKIITSGKNKGKLKNTGEVAIVHQQFISGAMGIILASIRPNSKYNVMTGNVWQRTPPPFSNAKRVGQSARGEFWAWAQERAEVMMKARHSSSGFFKLCANVVKMIFIGEVYKQGPGSVAINEITGAAGAGTMKVSREVGRLAGGTLARGDGEMARASFWVTTTEPDTKGKPGHGFERRIMPVWQRAVDDEAASIMAHYIVPAYAEAARSAGIKVVAA